MKQKYIIRETSVPYDPPYTPLYFHGFTTRGAGVCMVFGAKLAAEYDTLEAANKTLVKVKELSGRDTWDVDVQKTSTQFKSSGRFSNLPVGAICETCGYGLDFHEGRYNKCPS